MKQHLWGNIVLLLGMSLSVATLAWSEGWERGEYEEHESKNNMEQSRSHHSMAMNKTYQEECSACHFAYPAGFLPARSWDKIMDNLEHHFGENAELSRNERHEIEHYLINHAAEKSSNRFGRHLARSLSEDETPMRITETYYFQRRHHEVPRRMVQGNPKVRSFANCQSCHTGAEQGNFGEWGIRIPGFGRWED